MLAQLTDLADGGFIPNAEPDEDTKSRALGLLEKASNQVAAYLGLTQLQVVAMATAEQLGALAAVVAEIAGSRLNRSGASNVDSFTGTGYESMVMNRGHERAINRIFGRPGGSASIEVTRDTTTSWFTVEPPLLIEASLYDFDIMP